MRPDGLAPAEVFFDSLADDLTEAVARMAGGTAVDRAAAATRGVGGNVRRDSARTTPGHEIGGVVSLLNRLFIAVSVSFTSIRIDRNG
jgi:hypothetical protein